MVANSELLDRKSVDDFNYDAADSLVVDPGGRKKTVRGRHRTNMARTDVCVLVGMLCFGFVILFGSDGIGGMGGGLFAADQTLERFS